MGELFILSRQKAEGSRLTWLSLCLSGVEPEPGPGPYPGPHHISTALAYPSRRGQKLQRQIFN